MYKLESLIKLIFCFHPMIILSQKNWQKQLLLLVYGNFFASTQDVL